MAEKVLSYGFSLAGRSHVAADIPCQDSHIIKSPAQGWTLAAVADGLGSALYSHIGSALAVEKTAKFCEAYFSCEEYGGKPLELLKAGFGHALSCIEEEAALALRPANEYDTTLTAVLLNGSSLYIGHCGDGGAIAMDAQGRYHMLTGAQKGDAWNEVCPLRAGESAWEFFEVREDFCGVLLLTDGILDVAVPALLSGCDSPVYSAFVYRFLNGEMASLSIEDFAALSGMQKEFIQSDACAAITDDASAVALLDPGAVQGAPPEEYLKEPDWEALRKERYNKLYPHLQAEKSNASGFAPEEDTADDYGKQE